MNKIILIAAMGLMIYGGWVYAGKVPAERKEKLNSALSLAEEYESKGYYKDANLEYEKALQLEDRKEVRRKIVMNYYKMEDLKGFKKEAESYLRQNPDEEIYTYLIKDYLDNSDRTNAGKYLDKAEKEFPESESLAELRSNLNGQFTLSYTDYSEIGEYMDGYVIAGMCEEEQDSRVEDATDTDAESAGEKEFKVLLNNKGKVAVQNRFDEICDVKDGDVSSTGLLDATEKSVAESVLISGITSGEKEVASLDEDGIRRAVESGGFEYMGVAHEGWILAKKDGKWGYIAADSSADGNEKKEDTGFIYEDATVYDNGAATVKMNGKWAIVGSDGKLRTDYIYDDIYMDELRNASRGGAIFVKASGEDSWSLIDVKGKLLTSEKYTDVKGFLGNKGVAAAQKNGKWGAVDNKGVEILICEYDETGSSETDYIPYKKGDKWGYISPSGKELIEPQFEDMRAVSPDGYGFVKDRGTWEIITVYSIRGEESLFD